MKAITFILNGVKDFIMFYLKIIKTPVTFVEIVYGVIGIVCYSYNLYYKTPAVTGFDPIPFNGLGFFLAGSMIGLWICHIFAICACEMVGLPWIFEERK